MKNITVLTGSANKNGTSHLLADKFEQGAIHSQNKVMHFDVGILNVNGCSGCNYCRKNGGLCYQTDDFILVKESLLKSDVVVFVTPLYYFGMSAQLKTVIDRFHSISGKLSEKVRSGVLISTQASPLDSTAKVLISH